MPSTIDETVSRMLPIPTYITLRTQEKHVYIIVEVDYENCPNAL